MAEKRSDLTNDNRKQDNGGCHSRRKVEGGTSKRVSRDFSQALPFLATNAVK